MSGGSVRSMTGYAVVRRQTELGDLTVSLRSVNHRGLDLHFYHGQEFGPFENEMRQALKKGLARGHVEVRTALIRTGAAGQQGLNRQALRQYVAAFRAAAEEFELEGQPDLNRWLGLPGSLVDRANGQEDLPDGFGAALFGAVHECIGELNDTREREGAALREAMAEQVREIEQQTASIRQMRGEAVRQFNRRLRERLSELLENAHISEARLAEEAAILADRSDIEEELTRLAVHTGELRQLLERGGEVGKKVDFLLQEMNRETNTALAKSANAGEPGLRITSHGLAIKASIERIREQGLNLE